MKTFLKCVAIIALTLCALAAIPGCAIIEDNPNTARAAVYVGTLKYVGEDAERAQRVENTASEILSGMSGGTTIDQLDGRLRALIPWDQLDMADAILLHALLTELRSTMVATIGEGLLSPDDAVRIERVAQWVISAARLAQ